ncbi:MAG: acyl-CoA dehydrogenase family protein [Mycobacteriales bacterium]
MNLVASKDQEALVRGVRELVAGTQPRERLRALAEGPAAGVPDRAGWAALGGAGVFGLRRPEAAGGVGLGMVEAVLVFEELGRGLVPGPLVATHLASGVVDGAVVGLVEEVGQPILVEYLEALDVLVVLDASGVRAVEVAELRGALPVTPLDPLTPVCRVGELPPGRRIGGPDLAEKWRREGAALVAALQVGLAAASLSAAVTYALRREQFGRPIGSFQAIKHLLADLHARVELARAGLYAAAALLDDPAVGERDRDRAVSVARVCAAEAAERGARDAIQVHGGMGFTWEVDAHLFLKRAWVLSTCFGSPDQHAERVAALG